MDLDMISSTNIYIPLINNVIIRLNVGKIAGRAIEEMTSAGSSLMPATNMANNPSDRSPV
ncbi:hypothetical protein GCM10027291_20730 [Telluribacter humicola]